jgi:hypothetical protein
MIYALTPIKKNEWGQYERETLELKEEGQIICSCLNNLYEKNRDFCSVCKHTYQFLEDLRNNNLEDYILYL